MRRRTIGLAIWQKKAGIAWTPKVDADQEAMLSTLRGLSGTQFDVAYMHGQFVKHQKTVQLLQWN